MVANAKWCEGCAANNCEGCEDECVRRPRFPDLNLASPTPPRLAPNALGNLHRAAETFRDRNRTYGGNYKRMGALILALFPPGGVPEITTEAEANRLNLMIDCLGKLQRYAYAFHKGGHRDSAHDLIVYAAMLEEETQ